MVWSKCKKQDLEQGARGKVWEVLGWAVFVVACGLLLVGLFVNYRAGLDTDMSAELRLAKLLAEGKGFIVSDQWFYSTELRFLHTQLVFTPLFWFFDNWLVVRMVGTVILHAIMLLAFYWFLKVMGKEYVRVFPWLASLLLLPVSNVFCTYVNFGVYYIPHFTISFVAFALFFMTLKQTTTKKYWLYFGLGVGLALLAGIGGFRQVATLYFPLLITAGIIWLLNRPAADDQVIKKRMGGGLICVGYLVAALIGLGINYLLSNWLSFRTYPNLTWPGFSCEIVEDSINNFIRDFGYRSDVGLLNGALTNVIALALVLLYVVSVVYIIKHRSAFSYPENMITVYSVVAILVICGLTFFIVDPALDLCRYLLPAVVFVLPVCAIYLLHVRPDQKIFTYFRWGIYALTVVSCLFTYVTYYWQHQTFVFWEIDQAALQVVAQELVDRGYLQGYCGFNENILTEYSNGQIQTWCFGNNIYWGQSFDNLTDMDPWLQETNRMTTHPEGKVFVVLNNYDMQTTLGNKLSHHERENLLFRYNAISVFGFDNFDQLSAIANAPEDVTNGE